MRATEAPKAPRAPRAPRAHVLIVDDTPQNALLLRAQLEREGYRVTAVESGQEGLTAASADPPDVVLLDILMPGMDGYEVCRRLRAAETTRAIPVVMLTALRDAGTKATALEAGADDFLTKPFDRTDLLARVASLVRAKRLYDEVAKSRDDIRALNAALEQRVAERTAALQAALADLELLHQRTMEQERLRALGQMASGVAHDLNNALAPVIGFAELLLERPETLADVKTARHYLRLVLTGANDAAETVRRLREFYRPREESDPLEEVALEPLVEQVIDLTRPKWKDQAQAAGVKIEVKAEYDSAPPAAGVQSELREALTNLIFNAVDSMPHGGTITVHTRRDGASRVAISVSDTGVGMDEETRQRCLEPFFTTKGARGTGLGLAMVHGIVSRHRGALDVQSKLGCGTTITLKLPIWRAARTLPAASDRAAELLPPSSRRLTVLVVDDEPVVRTVTAEALAHDGHAVVEASDASQALDTFTADPRGFDLVITDLALPGMSGDRLAVEIKRLNPTVPVIMLTGFGGLMNATPPLGVDGMLSKPVSLAALRDAVRHVHPA